MKMTIIPILGILLITDYQLIVVNNPKENTCTKDLKSCNTLKEAITKGYIKDIPKNSNTYCIEKPNCFSAKSNCIKNFNC